VKAVCGLGVSGRQSIVRGMTSLLLGVGVLGHVQCCAQAAVPSQHLSPAICASYIVSEHAEGINSHCSC
jgi:hypothetical protein